jgi:hypothetical protein
VAVTALEGEGAQQRVWVREWGSAGGVGEAEVTVGVEVDGIGASIPGPSEQPTLNEPTPNNVGNITSSTSAG